MGADAEAGARLVAVCVGQPRLLAWRDRRLRSAIDKRPVGGPVAVRPLGLEGDRQEDPRVHGGPWKAVYLYPSEHYAAWRRELGRPDLAYGSLGENLASTGLDESRVSVGDVFRVGSAELQVTTPRLPCAKLIARLQRDDAGKRMLDGGRTGFYLRVRREGRVRAGDAIDRIEADPGGVSVAALLAVYTRRNEDPELLERVVSLPALPEGWRHELRARRA